MRTKGSKNAKTLERIARGRMIAKERGICLLRHTAHYIKPAKEEEASVNELSAKATIIRKRGRKPLAEGQRQVVRTLAAPQEFWDAIEQYRTALGLSYFSNAFRDVATMALEDLGFLPRGGKDVREPPKEGASS